MIFKKRWFWYGLIILLILFLCPRIIGRGGQESQAGNRQTGKKDTKKKPKNPREDPEEIGNRDVGKGVNLYSIEKEIALGKTLAQEVEKSARVIDDPTIAEYINRIGQNIVRNSDAKVPFTIKVIDSEDINAFSLPGGFLFVNSGLILKTETEAELAGVMAHEIAHVTARHGTRQATRNTIANYASMPLVLLGGWTGYAIQQAAGLAIPMSFLKFSRGFEQEADYLGLQYLYKAGYDPMAFIDFFERIQSLEKRKPGTLTKVFASHPMTDDRIKRTQINIQKILAEKPAYVVTTSEYLEVKDMLDKKINTRKVKPEKGGPTLRKRSSGKIEDETKDKKPDEDERPTLKRRNQ